MRYLDIPQGYQIDYENSTDTKLALVPCYNNVGIDGVVKFVLNKTDRVPLINNLTHIKGTNKFIGVAPDDCYRDFIDEIIKMSFIIKYYDLAYYEPNDTENNCTMTFRLFKTEVTDSRNGNDYNIFALRAVPAVVSDNYNLFTVRSKTIAKYLIDSYGEKLKNILVGIQHMFNIKVD